MTRVDDFGYEEYDMKKQAITIIVGILCVVLLVIVVFFFANRTHGLQSIKKGELISATDSPNGSYTMNLYLQNGGATTAYGVLGELICNTDGAQKNIYYEYRTNSTNCKWIDEYTVIINGQKLDVRYDTYDWNEYQTDDVGPLGFLKLLADTIIGNFLMIFK